MVKRRLFHFAQYGRNINKCNPCDGRQPIYPSFSASPKDGPFSFATEQTPTHKKEDEETTNRNTLGTPTMATPGNHNIPEQEIKTADSVIKQQDFLHLCMDDAVGEKLGSLLRNAVNSFTPSMQFSLVFPRNFVALNVRIEQSFQLYHNKKIDAAEFNKILSLLTSWFKEKSNEMGSVFPNELPLWPDSFHREATARCPWMTDTYLGCFTMYPDIPLGRPRGIEGESPSQGPKVDESVDRKIALEVEKQHSCKAAFKVEEAKQKTAVTQETEKRKTLETQESEKRLTLEKLKAAHEAEEKKSVTQETEKRKTLETQESEKRLTLETQESEKRLTLEAEKSKLQKLKETHEAEKEKVVTQEIEKRHTNKETTENELRLINAKKEANLAGIEAQKNADLQLLAMRQQQQTGSTEADNNGPTRVPPTPTPKKRKAVLATPTPKKRSAVSATPTTKKRKVAMASPGIDRFKYQTFGIIEMPEWPKLADFRGMLTKKPKVKICNDFAPKGQKQYNRTVWSDGERIEGTAIQLWECSCGARVRCLEIPRNDLERLFLLQCPTGDASLRHSNGKKVASPLGRKAIAKLYDDLEKKAE
jgi:hypothetical protein